MLLVAAAVLLVAGAYTVFTYVHGGDPVPINTETVDSAAPEPTRVIVHHPEPTQAATPGLSLRKRQLVPPTLHVDASSYSATGFAVGPAGARIIGGFNSSSPVECFVSDARFLQSLQDGQSFPTIWNSGRITATTQIDVILPEGNYLIGFNNRFSLLTTKTIRSEINLQEPTN